MKTHKQKHVDEWHYPFPSVGRSKFNRGLGLNWVKNATLIDPFPLVRWCPLTYMCRLICVNDRLIREGDNILILGLMETTSISIGHTEQT